MWRRVLKKFYGGSVISHTSVCCITESRFVFSVLQIRRGNRDN